MCVMKINLAFDNDIPEEKKLRSSCCTKNELTNRTVSASTFQD